MKFAAGLTALLICAGLSARKESAGEALLKQGRALWEEYNIDLSSHKWGDVIDVLTEAVIALKDEGKDGAMCDACLLLCEAYSKDYQAHEAAILLCGKVLEYYPDSTSIQHFRACFLLAETYLHYGTEKSLRFTSKRFGVDESEVSAADMIASFSVLGKMNYTMDNFQTVAYCFSEIRKLDPAGMDRYTLVKYVDALSYYSYLLISAGRMSDAEDVFRICLDLVQQNSLMNSSAMITLKFTAATYFLQKGMNEDGYRMALDAFNSAREYRGPTAVESIQSAMVLAALSAKVGKTEQGVRLVSDLLESVSQYAGKDSLPYYDLISVLGRVYSEAGDYASSARYYGEAAEYAQAHKHSEIDAFSNLVLALSAAGRTEDALKAAKDAQQVLRDYFHQSFMIRPDSFRDASWSHSGYKIVRSIANAVEPSSDGDGILYDLALLSKGVLLDSSTQFVEMIKSRGGPELKRAWEIYSGLQYELEEEYGRPRPDPATVGSLQEKLVHMEGVLMNLNSVVPAQEVFWCDVSWKEVSMGLRSGEAAVEYFRYPDWWTGENVYFVSVLLPRQRPVNVPLEGVDEAALKALSLESLCSSGVLYDLFVRPVEHLLAGCRTVYYSPAGIMHSLPLECVVSSFDLVRLSTTRRLLEERGGTDLASAVFFGGLDYNLDPGEMEYYSRAARGGSAAKRDWPFLKGSLDEVTAAYRLLDTEDKQLVTGGEGVEERFKALSGTGVNLIHVATHGYSGMSSSGQELSGKLSQEDRAMYSSGLVFAGANNAVASAVDGMDDGLLSSMEISRLNLAGCDLLVLSACGTGTVFSGRMDDLYGLMRAFKKAGCRSILMTLWDVDDAVTAQLMDAFYRARLSGKDNSSALASAREAIRLRHPDPEYWAPFIIID